MLLRALCAAFACALLVPSIAGAVPVDVLNPVFRQVRVFLDAPVEPTWTEPNDPFHPQNDPNAVDVAQFSLHGLNHPGSTDNLRSGASATNGVMPTLRLGAGAFDDYYDLSSLPQVGSEASPSPIFVEVPALTTFAYGGSSPLPDPLDGQIFTFSSSGDVIELGLNADNGPSDGGGDGITAVPGSFSDMNYVIDLTTTDAEGGYPVVMGTLTGLVFVDGLSDPNKQTPDKLAHYDNGNVDPNGAFLGDDTIGLISNNPSGGYGISASGGLVFWCGSVLGSAAGVCQFQSGHGYMHQISNTAGDPAASSRPLTGVAHSQGLAGAWGILGDPTGSLGSIIDVLNPIGDALPIATPLPGQYVSVGALHGVGALGIGQAGTVPGLVFMSQLGDIAYAEVAAIPEPGTALLLGGALAGLAALRGKRHRHIPPS